MRPVFQPSAEDVFDATQNLKRHIQEIAKPSYSPAMFQASMPMSERGIVYGARDFAAPLADTLENRSIWGEAGDAQRIYNAQYTKLRPALTDFMSAVGGKELGEGVADPGKVKTLWNKIQNGEEALKIDKVKNMKNIVSETADAINGLYEGRGMAAPFDSQINPTPALDRILDTPKSIGVKMARWMMKNGASALANEAGHLGGGGIGAGIGFLVGHPMVGGYIGDRLLKPIIAGLAKPFAEQAVSSEGVKTAIEYASKAINGQKALSEAVGNFFKPGALILSKEAIPDQASRDKLQKSLDYAAQPQNAENIGAGLGHYLRDHATAASMTAQTAVNHFSSIKPKPAKVSPLDPKPKATPAEQAAYNRQLDIAQNPLMILRHAKHGTLQPQDIQTFKTIYPHLANAVASKLAQGMIDHVAHGGTIPYRLRIGLSELTGQPVDSTITQPAMASIVAANAPKGPPPQPQGKQKKPSGSSIASMQKMNKIYATPEQSRAANRVDVG